MDDKLIAFATSCDLNYLSQAHTLATSVKKIYPESKFILGLNESLEGIDQEIKRLTAVFDEVLIGAELHPIFQVLESRYGVIELCCATKPALLKHCFESGHDYVIYLDPDTYLVDSLEEAFSYLCDKDNHAAFTPHLTRLGNLEMEISSMTHGVLNLGFLALRRSSEVDEFLTWWDTRLQTLCIRNPNLGIFTDQSWAALGLGVLNSKIIRHSGYNFATWNLGDHVVTEVDKRLYIDQDHLVFAHFSGFSVGGVRNFIQKYDVKISNSYLKLLNDYTNMVQTSAELLVDVISKKTAKKHYKKRRIYRKSRNELKIAFIDQLSTHAPLALKILIWAKGKVRR